MRLTAAKLFRWVLFIIVAAAAALFAVANREAVVVSFDPLPYSVEPPLYLAIFAMVVAGGLIGALVTWLSGHRARRELARARRRLTAMENELHGVRAQLAEPAEPAAPAVLEDVAQRPAPAPARPPPPTVPTAGRSEDE